MSNNYTKPKLRERIKNTIKHSNIGGTKAGQWSARKSQLLATRYEKAGGGYKSGKTKTQRALSRWTKQKWTTADGGNSYRQTKRGRTIVKKYLPKASWDNLNKSEITKLNRSKQKAYREGKQFSKSPIKLRNKISNYWKH